MRYRIYNQNGINFLTFSIVDWIDLFTRSIYCDIFLDSLRFCQKEKGLQLFAYVIMPSHVHLIMQTDDPRGLSSIIHSIKSFTAKAFINQIIRTDLPESRREWLMHHFSFNARRNRRNSTNQVWQTNNHPIALYSPKAIRANLNYIHQNPVKANMVRKAEQYIYSSASNYRYGKGLIEVELFEDIWNDVGYLNLGG